MSQTVWKYAAQASSSCWNIISKTCRTCSLAWTWCAWRHIKRTWLTASNSVWYKSSITLCTNTISTIITKSLTVWNWATYTTWTSRNITRLTRCTRCLSSTANTFCHVNLTLLTTTNPIINISRHALSTCTSTTNIIMCKTVGKGAWYTTRTCWYETWITLSALTNT